MVLCELDSKLDGGYASTMRMRLENSEARVKDAVGGTGVMVVVVREQATEAGCVGR